MPGGVIDWLTSVDDKLDKTNKLLKAQLEEERSVEIANANIDLDKQSSITSTLAARGGWEYKLKDFDQKVLDAGDNFTLVDEEGKGVVLSTNATVVGSGGEKTRMKLKVDGFVADITVEGQYNAGLTQPSGGYYPYVSRYAKDNPDGKDVFSITVDNPTGHHFRNNVEVFIEAPSDIQNKLVLNGTFVMVDIYDMDEFMGGSE